MPDGTMSWHLIKDKCKGYEAYDTVQFDYSFPCGKKADGTNYTGTHRTAYMPASPEGIIVFKMLVEAFRRRLSFMVGTSLTTGQTNTVVWSGIHHKTSIWGGQFGYPDMTYIGRVTEELKVRDLDAESVQNQSINLNHG